MAMAVRKRTSTTEVLISPTYMPPSRGLVSPLNRAQAVTRFLRAIVKEVRETCAFARLGEMHAAAG